MLPALNVALFEIVQVLVSICFAVVLERLAELAARIAGLASQPNLYALLQGNPGQTDCCIVLAWQI